MCNKYLSILSLGQFQRKITSGWLKSISVVDNVKETKSEETGQVISNKNKIYFLISLKYLWNSEHSNSEYY